MRNLTSSAVVLVTLAMLAPPARAGEGVHLIVQGTIDEDGLRDRLASELGMPVTLADMACETPCIDVRIDSDRATVVFTPRNGRSRERTVELGDDPGQWPLVVTLLAGNVVRDEAADVLAELPEPRIGPQPQAGPVGAPEPLGVAPPPPPPDVVIVIEGHGPSTVAPVPPPPPLAPVAGDELDRPWTMFGFGLVPGLSTDFNQVGNVRHFLSFDLIAGVSGGSSGLTFGGIVDVERGPVSGLQLAGITAFARRVSGTQVGGIVAVSSDLEGIQVGGIASVARNASGVQVGGIASVAHRADAQFAGIAAASRTRAGIQAAGIAVVADSARFQVGGIAAAARHEGTFQFAGIAAAAGSASVQAAGIASVSRGDTDFQVGGITSVSRNANVQVSGIVNVANRARGVQIAPINVARRIEGVQVGVVNIGRSDDGFSLGLINIVPGGRYDLEAALDSSDIGTLLFRHGGNGWHNVYGIAGHPVDETGPTNDVWSYGFGFGPSWRLSTARVDLEAIGWQINHGARHSSDISILGQLRLSVAYGLGPFAVVVGGAYNTYVTNDLESPLLLERRAPSAMPTTREVTVEHWPSAFVGLRL